MNVIAFHFCSHNVTKDHVMQLHFLEMSNIDLTVYFEQYYLFILSKTNTTTRKWGSVSQYFNVGVVSLQSVC